MGIVRKKKKKNLKIILNIFLINNSKFPDHNHLIQDIKQHHCIFELLLFLTSAYLRTSDSDLSIKGTSAKIITAKAGNVRWPIYNLKLQGESMKKMTK